MTGTTFNDTATGSIIQIDGDHTLTLSGATIHGGTINDYSTASGSIIAGDIDITGSSTIDNGASLNNGHVTIENGQTLSLDDDGQRDHGAFAGAGTLELGQPSAFAGAIAGITGSSDVLDLAGFDAAHDTVVASTGAGSFNSSTDTTSLLVTDQNTGHSVTLNFLGIIRALPGPSRMTGTAAPMSSIRRRRLRRRSPEADRWKSATPPRKPSPSRARPGASSSTRPRVSTAPSPASPVMAR